MNNESAVRVERIKSPHLFMACLGEVAHRVGRFRKTPLGKLYVESIKIGILVGLAMNEAVDTYGLLEPSDQVPADAEQTVDYGWVEWTRAPEPFTVTTDNGQMAEVAFGGLDQCAPIEMPADTSNFQC